MHLLENTDGLQYSADTLFRRKIIFLFVLVGEHVYYAVQHDHHSYRLSILSLQFAMQQL